MDSDRGKGGDISRVLDVVEEMLRAGLAAIRRIRHPEEARKQEPVSDEGMSQIDMAFAILKDSGESLHVTDIIARIRERFDREVDRESLVSALSKRVARRDRFRRTDRNTFALLAPGKKEEDQ